jgi:large subunit ribosomal protein L10
MGMKKDDKQALVAEVNAVAATAQSAVAAHYRGLTVSQMTQFRAKARGEGVYVRVVKNTLARRAVQGTSFEILGNALKGPTILAFSREEPGAAARVIKDFSKENAALVPVAVAIGGQLLPGSALERVARLPTREQALSQLAGLLKAPVEKLVRTIAEPAAKLVRTIAAVRDQKQQAG